MKKAALLSQIPHERFHAMDGGCPKIGDVVVLDQGFTFEDGKPGYLVYCIDKAGVYMWGAEVYEHEIGDDMNS